MRGIPSRTIGLAGMAAGEALMLLSVFADRLGPSSHPEVIGWKQLTALGVGALLTLVGATIALRPKLARVPKPEVADAVRESEESVSDVPVYDSAARRVPFIYELRELYRYRFLLWNLVSRDLKVRYKRSALGFLWAMINPLLTMAVMLAVFTRLFRFQVEHYPIYILSGILLWQLFSRGTSLAMHSVLASSIIRRKIYVPASVFVAASVGSAFVNLLFALGPLLALTLIMGVRPSIAWSYLPVPILQIVMLVFGVGLIIAAASVIFADVLDIYEVLLTAIFYLSAIIYPVSILPPVLARAEQFNLFYCFVDAFRKALIQGELPAPAVLIGTTLGAILLTVAGWSFFTRLSDQFAYRA